jgi:hypothetical protein
VDGRPPGVAAAPCRSDPPAFFPTRNITVKIGAIEHRSRFNIHDDDGYSVGIELGSDASAPLNLDDFMVFAHDPDRAIQFFEELLYRHVVNLYLTGEVEGTPPPTGADLVRETFTRTDAFQEFVRAAEGVPRDALHIATYAARQAQGGPISVPVVRAAARSWYLREKESIVRSREEAYELLIWIIDRVIGKKRARAFLLEQRQDVHPLIRFLYDARVLHVVRRGIAARDKPGIRFDAYALDYGCYVEMLTTAKAPRGLFPVISLRGNDDDEDSPDPDRPLDQYEYPDVPTDDYKSIRQAILVLDDFAERTRSLF